MSRKIVLSPKELELITKYYITEDYSQAQVAELLHRPQSQIEHLLRKYNIRKPDNMVKKTLSKELLRELFIDKNMSPAEIAKQYGFPENSVSYLIYDLYKLKKDRSLSLEASRRTQLSKFGVEHYSQTAECQEKRKKTCLAKYGAKTPMQDSGVKNKVRQTCLEKYGVENYSSLPECRAKVKQTNLDRYGVEHCLQSKVLQEKARQTCKERYGVYCYTQKDIDAETLEIMSTKENLESYLHNHPNLTIPELAKQLNCHYLKAQRAVRKFGLQDLVDKAEGYSDGEEEVRQFIQEHIAIVCNSQKILDSGKELDIYIPSKKVAVEYNGTYWHSSSKKADREYHFKKSYECEQKGIRLIHVYEHQWENPVKREILKSIILNAIGENTTKIYARKCVVKELTAKDVREFSEKNSLHGHRNAKIYLGLFYHEELVEVMTFGKAFFSQDDSISFECIRSITRLNTTVVGGMNKLFQHFITNYQPAKILYYVDYNTHNGNSMEKLGFTFVSYSKYGIINVANSKEAENQYGKVFTRRPAENKKIRKLIAEHKVYSVYDAGVKKYI